LSEEASIPNQEKSIHNVKVIDADIIIQNAYSSFLFYLWLSYTARRQAIGLTPASETHNERIERLLIHCYDDSIELIEAWSFV